MEDCTATKPYKQRFKGVENFLRRIAFNLGNTPSQTEVKVISCIPIDVTDLQEKIISLERQLHEAKKQIQEDEPVPESETDNGNEMGTDKNEKNSDNKQIKGDKQGPSTVVNTAFVSQSSTVSYLNKKPAGKMMHQIFGYCEDPSLRQENPIGCLEPAPNSQACGTQDNHSEEVEDVNINTKSDAYKKIFQRRKKKQVFRSNSNVKTQFIYYAQGSPENPFHLQDNILINNDNMDPINQLSKSYLNSVLRRQYDPKFALEEFSDTSQFSKPFCRDVKVKNKLNHPYLYESDECSCCRGKFQNLDKFITNYLTFDALNTSPFNQSHNDKTYYDSNFYDVVPVKDDGNINKKTDVLHKKEYKRRPDTKCWPEKHRNKCRYHPFIVKSYKENLAKAISHRRDVDEVRVKRDRAKKREKRASCQCSRNGCIECSNVYTKPENTKNIKMRKSQPVRKILLIDEKVETDMNILLKCNNQSTQSKVLPLEEDRTESTLNQIKTILQSVLEEVKTNSNVSTVQEISKKDAIIQKESSQNNLDNSAIFNDFTTKNSCNANLYLPSCSRQMSQSPYYFPSVPYQQTKCLQNFPVFIHPASRKPMCGCYYRQSSHKTSHNKQAITTTATNTENKNTPKSCSNETEKLIKEIYKSVTLNMDYPIKENSLSDYEDLKPITVDSLQEHIEEKNTNKEDASPRRDMEVEAVLSPLISNTNERKYVYTATSTQFQNERIGSNLSVSYTTARHDNRNGTDDHGAMKQSHATIDYEEDESDEYSDDTETDETIVPSGNKQNKSEKRGFIKRMFNSVKLFKKRKNAQTNVSQVEVTGNSDSDETQTVCSVRTKGRKRNMVQMTREQYSKHGGPIDQKYSRRRAPYLEQEYRRQWNEDLMFYEPPERYPAAEHYAKPFASQPRPSPVFWRNYEARTALVDHNIRNVKKIEQGTSSPTCQEREDDKTSKLDWIKRRKLGLRCGEQWKKFILEN